MAEGDLRRQIGFWGGTALIVGIVIGSGIFRTPSSIARDLPNPWVILSLWAAFGLVSVCGALTLAELSSMMPRTGGVYVFLRDAYGPATAFVYGWLHLVITAPASAGALAAFFTELLVQFFPQLEGASGWVFRGLAVSLIVFLATANVLGVRYGTWIQGLFTAIKSGALAALIVVAFGFGTGSFTHLAPEPADRVTLAGLATAAAAIIWTYDGWVAVSMVAGEIRDPGRLMKRIIVVGMLVIVVLYLGANLAYFYALSRPAMAQETVVASKVMSLGAGGWGATAINLCILASVFGALNANLLARPRVAYAMARDGLSFGFLGRPHPSWATPHMAIIVQAAVSVALIFALWVDRAPTHLFDRLTTYFVVVEWFALMFAVGAVFVLRRRMPDAPRPYRTPAYPWVPLLFVLGTVAGLGIIVWQKWEKREYYPLVGLAIAAAGFPVYFAWRRLTGSAPGSAGPEGPPPGASRP